MQITYRLEKNYKNKTKIDPTTAIIISNIFTDFKYLFVSGLTSPFPNAPAPKEITTKKSNTNNSIVIKIPNFPTIFLLNIHTIFDDF